MRWKVWNDGVGATRQCQQARMQAKPFRPTNRRSTMDGSPLRWWMKLKRDLGVIKNTEVFIFTLALRRGLLFWLDLAIEHPLEKVPGLFEDDRV